MDAARLVRETRRHHGLNQRALARRCRTSQTYISRIERGEVSPTVETLAKLLQAMGEQLVLDVQPGPTGNQSTEELRAGFQWTTPEERIAQAAELSYALTSLAGAGKAPDPSEWPRDGTPSPRREPPLRPLELLARLREHRVDFVVTGGFSLAAYGYVRGTKDVDIVPDPNSENLKRLLGALETLDAEPLALGDVRRDEILDLNLQNLALGGNWLLLTRSGRLDVMQDVEGMRSYDELREGAFEPVMEELPEGCLFAGRDDLIALKRAAGRDEDLRDIAELERARGAGS